ncbi:MAG: class D sortase [Gammaproteobacteria bacterium]|nr:class D sortase [Gammaproteobacteria bacterium]
MHGNSNQLLRRLEVLAWLAAGLLLGFYFIAAVHADRASGRDLQQFERSALQVDAAEQSLWSESRKAAYRESLTSIHELPEAVLRIPAIALEAPVWAGTDEVTLNRAVGRVPQSASAGEAGNVVLAAHRDGFFRELGELAEGDTVVIQTLQEQHRYVVRQSLIVEPDAVHVMDDTGQPILTLITCYPFYFVGPAPQRYVVRAVLETSATGGTFQ